MEEIAGVITQVVDHIGYNERSEDDQPEIVEGPFQAFEVDSRSCHSNLKSYRRTEAGIYHQVLSDA